MSNKFFSKKNAPVIILISVSLAIVIAIVSVFTVFLVKSGRGKNGGLLDGNSSISNVSSENSSSTPEEDNELPNKGGYEKVPYVPMPTGLNGKTLSETEMLNAYRGYTDWRIYTIRTTKDEIKPAAGGTAYYLSNRGSSRNDGSSPDKAFKNLSDLGKIKSKLKAGDVIYLERGSIFRGQLVADVEGITYAAYGEGKKPTIYASPGNAAERGEWKQTKENENIYKYSISFSNDIGTIVFNEGEKHAIKCIIRTEADGKTYNNTTGKEFETYADLDENLHFYHDYSGSGALYLYCEGGNPAELFDSIEFNVKSHIISVKADNIHIDNLCLKYGGAHGIAGGTRNGLTVTNCEFQWIGGSIQAEGIFGRNYATRYGNAVEIYGGCNGYKISNCYFNQVYDAATTFQYSTDGSSDKVMQNVDISDNVMENCNYSFEYFLSGGLDTTSYMKDIKIKNNLMWYAGYGLCEQRPDKNQDAHIKAWNHTNARQGVFQITDNLFAIAKNDLVQSNARTGSHSPTYSNNTYIQFMGGNLGTSQDAKTKVEFGNMVAQMILDMLGDEKPTIVYVKK
ncbi:MAG: hypothetical protein IKY12_00960 [Clostridia bacterium]|nr:hypothetical protein [Clostridia bacterium]